MVRDRRLEKGRIRPIQSQTRQPTVNFAQMDLNKGDFYLGKKISGDSATEEPLVYDSADLTTHGVIVGMTGSGKTGLGIDMLEEALLSNIPCLVIDPKGDMGNLLLSFPEFKASDFRPWIDEAEAEREGVSPDDLAADKANLWKTGLEGAGITGERLRRLNQNSDITVYTPGSGAGIGLNVLGSLKAPNIDWNTEAEIGRDEIEGLVSSILLLANVEADPVSDPAHILLSSIVEHAWSNGKDLDLATLVGQIPKPPFRKLGVFELDTFFPESDRMALAMKLNGLLASPSFSSWLEGRPLDIEAMLGGSAKTKAAVVYLAHLSDTERQFMVTLLLSRLITWLRQQSGTSDLRALVYMDEVFGFVPPVKEPPSKKAILTILKQARAFGVGMVLSTQNPVDVDYKALSNAGTWMIGRLQTEQDKGRLLDGLNAATGNTDTERLSDLISSLDKRQFILHSTRESEPQVFGTRWAQSYLAGPLTRDQVSRLMADVRDLPSDEQSDEMGQEPAGSSPEPQESKQPGGASIDEDSVPVMPPLAEKVRSFHLDQAATWAETVGSKEGGRYQLGAAATVQLLYDDAASDLNHQETYEAVVFPLGPVLDPGAILQVDHDERDFNEDAGPSPSYVIPDAKVDTASFWTGLEKDLKNYLVANRRVEIFKNPKLKTYSRVGEEQSDFVERCREVASEAADAELAKLKDKYETRINRVKDQIAKAENRVFELDSKAQASKQEELLTGVGDLLGGLLGGRKSSTTLSKAASRRKSTRNAEARADAAALALEDKREDLLELEAELEDDVIEITDKYDDYASDIESMEVGLEAADVRVAELKAVWIPV